MLLEVFIMRKKGSVLLLRRSFTKKKQLKVDGNLFSGLISAISNFSSEIQIGQIQHFETGQNRVLICPYQGIVVVGIVEERKEEQFITESVKKISEAFWENFKDTINNFKGVVSVFYDFISEIDKIVYSEFEKTYISKDFPKNLIREIRKAQPKFENEILHFMGLKAGKKRGDSVKSLKDFKKKIKKEMSLFSICDVQDISDNEMDKKILVSIPMCPLCRQIKDKDFTCDFFTGFINGFAISSFPDKEIHVEETKCISHDEEACEFLITIFKVFDFHINFLPS